MPNQKISDLSVLAAAAFAADDIIAVVDVSDPTMAASGTDKFCTIATLFGAVPDGTVLLPSLSFISDPDTGIFLQAPNVISIAAGGNESLRFTTTGVGSNIFVDDGFAIVIGHTTQVTVGSAAKFQVLGTGGSDTAVIVGRWSDTAFAPKISFAKSRGTTIGSSVIVDDDDVVGLLRFCPDDGVGFTTLAAQFGAKVDDASPAVGDIGMAFTWEQMDGEGGVLKETMHLAAKGNLGLGVVPNINRQFDLGGLFNGNTRFSVTDILQSSGEAQQVFIGGTINAVANADAHGIRIAPTLVEAGSGTHNNFVSLSIVPPVVTVGAASLTNATTVKITGAPTGAINNYALWVAAGVSRFDGSVGMGVTTPATSALLELFSTTEALLVSRMTTTQRDALTAVNGMIIYNSTTATMQGRVNGAWANM